jgi:hypothetical protein
VILLFLNKDAVSWFGEGKSKFKSDRAARLGPVGAITEEQRKSLAGAQILVYTYYGRMNADNIDPISSKNLFSIRTMESPLFKRPSKNIGPLRQASAVEF